MSEKNKQATKQPKPPMDIKTRAKLTATARKFSLFNDIFMKYTLDDNLACQHLLRIITGIEDLLVTDVKPQYNISEMTSHDAILDVFATDSKGKLYSMEIQKADTLDHAKRCRFYSSMVDSKFLAKGSDYSQLPELYVIYISQTDIWKKGKTIYHVEKYLGNENIKYEDGVHTIFVNAAVNDGSAIAQLMQYFKTADPDDMSQGDLSKRVNLIKRQRGGKNIMRKITDALYEDELYKFGKLDGKEEGKAEGRAEGKAESERKTAMTLLSRGYPEEEVMDIFKISAATLQKWRMEAIPAK